MLLRLLNLALAVSLTAVANEESFGDGHGDLLATTTETVDTLSNSSNSFQLIALEPERICQVHPTCVFKPGYADSPCCGSCTCDTKCYSYGSCCLSSYQSFKDAHDSITNSR